MLTPSQALAAFPADHPLHQLARMLAHLAEHPAVDEVFLSDPPARLEHEVWVSVQLRAKPAGAGLDLARFADAVAQRFGWRLENVEEIGLDEQQPEYWALIWQPVPS
jgi:hypothetical protein